MDPFAAPIVLILTVVMPGNFADVNKFLSMPTLEECNAQALDWERNGLTSGIAVKGGIAVQASCRVRINGFNGS